jgi:hypothetical protein
MAAAGITVYAVGCEPALGGYRFARDFMCSLAEITGGQAVALSCADRLADVIINGSAEEISLTRLTREVEQEVERVRVTSYEPLDEEEVQTRAWQNLQSRGVKSKQMRHDGAMIQKNSSVWKGASSLAAAKSELCKSIPADDPADFTECAEVMMKGGASFSRSRGLGSTFRSMPAAALSARSSGVRKSKKMAMPEVARMSEDAFECRGGFDEALEASAPVGAASVSHNVLVEDEISYDQVKRIMARKSVK